MYVYTGANENSWADTKTNPEQAAINEARINKLLAEPTEFVYSDYYSYDSSLYSRPFGSYWSASVNSTTSSRFLGFAKSGSARSLYPQFFNDKGYACAVRCVGAGSGTVPTVSGSICPTNWSLPEFTDEVGVKSGTAPSYNNLTAAYDIVVNTEKGVNRILAIPLSFSRSGGFYVGDLSGRSGSGYGNYWSSRPYGGAGAYGLDFYSTASINQNGNSRRVGRSVRCVVGVSYGRKGAERWRLEVYELKEKY